MLRRDHVTTSSRLAVSIKISRDMARFPLHNMVQSLSQITDDRDSPVDSMVRQRAWHRVTAQENGHAASGSGGGDVSGFIADKGRPLKIDMKAPGNLDE